MTPFKINTSRFILFFYVTSRSSNLSKILQAFLESFFDFIMVYNNIVLIKWCDYNSFIVKQLLYIYEQK